MCSKVLFLSVILAIELFNVNASIRPTTLFIKQRAEEALQEQILKSKSDISSCHTYYSEILKNLLETYDAAVKQCEDTEKEQLSDLLTQGQQSRDTTTELLDKVCLNLQRCKEEPENLEFFDCVDDSGDSNTRSIWKASRDSSDIAAHIREQNHAIKFEAEKCSSDAEREYIVGTTKATDEMVACYANGGRPPSTASSEPDQIDESAR
ncbi:uncharacterized protein LOC129951401 [Eupeodes corollae]|uniref:uncharacterized protein LOC129951401 n=1 Tax=Eupeodes corollae TaxID=290404 RepID=UPI002492D1C0|nr:uncharacterized protein LOC129951401 [Eupeodes corollae]